ncbi:putative MFS family arabinose efflux permease [Sphingomonas vulcanisoli]|uniref:MFS family arabinose efflux permease n=1 Tax=Sphingomonas vulcanisoli TaxID=1658060 RepID=A0ABX0TRF0_9SPHN|nr:MFS transporter [Sphingomonas vulcanisoli]NIJ08102.1 putative MFS family arabinose efflux permease [Sphingomonas vulcanisoli]
MRNPARHGARLTLLLLTAVYVLNFVDRQLVAILGQPIKADLGLSDSRLGLLNGLAFALFNSALGLPIARIAERRSRIAVVSWSLALWSIATAACGLARGLPQLLVARIGVGIGEAGYVPAAQSIIADLWPRERRATALALFSIGIPVGILIGAVAGGWIADALGWRAAFLVLGIPGVALAAVIAFVLREPPRGAQDAATDAQAPAFGEVARALWSDRVFRNMAAGATLASTAGYGITGFAVPLLMRSYQLPLHVAATGFGLVVGAGIGGGIATGGWLADRLTPGRQNARAQVAGAGALIALAAFPLALSQSQPLGVALAAFPAFFGAHLYFGPVYATTADRVGPRARATAIALLLLAMNGLGLTIGPWLVGTLSDHFTKRALPDFAMLCASGKAQTAPCLSASASGLSSALSVDLFFYLWAAAHFLRAGWLVARDQPQSSAR